MLAVGGENLHSQKRGLLHNEIEIAKKVKNI